VDVREGVTRHQARVLAAVGVLTFFAVWCVLSYANIVPTVILPTPTEVLRAFPVLHFQEALVRSIGGSLYRVYMGFLLAAVVAIPLGLLMGTFPPIKHFFQPLLDPLRFLPISALVPLFIVWFGIDEMQKIVFLFVGIVVYLWTRCTCRRQPRSAPPRGSSSAMCSSRAACPPSARPCA
jgi:NitT/TauT family transport system permease protein